MLAHCGVVNSPVLRSKSIARNVINGVLAKAGTSWAAFAPEGDFPASATHRALFLEDLEDTAKARKVKLPSPVKKAILTALGERDPKAEICYDADGNREPDSELRDTENIPLPADTIRVPVPPLETQTRIAAFLDEKTPQIDALIEKKQQLLERLAEKRQAIITQAVTKGLDPSVPMKDSGIDWLGQIPAHWGVKRVKYIARLESGHTPDKKIDDYWENGDIPWVSLNDTAEIRANDYISDTSFKTNALGLANSSARLLPARAVVFTRDATIGESAITTRPMAVSQHLIAWICDEAIIEPEYLLLLIYGMTGELLRLTNGATIGTIGLGDVKELRVCVPPIQEQQEIVKKVFDSKLQLDQVLKAAQVSIDKLLEYRSALITFAVTGQLVTLR
jgi:type I restriction enzyme S subunit